MQPAEEKKQEDLTLAPIKKLIELDSSADEKEGDGNFILKKHRSISGHLKEI